MSIPKDVERVAEVVVVMPPAIAHEKPHRIVDEDPEKTIAAEETEVSEDYLDRLRKDHGVRPPLPVSHPLD
jgi:hypothetical protein